METKLTLRTEVRDRSSPEELQAQLRDLSQGQPSPEVIESALSLENETLSIALIRRHDLRFGTVRRSAFLHFVERVLERTRTEPSLWNPVVDALMDFEAIPVSITQPLREWFKGGMAPSVFRDAIESFNSPLMLQGLAQHTKGLGAKEVTLLVERDPNTIPYIASNKFLEDAGLSALLRSLFEDFSTSTSSPDTYSETNYRKAFEALGKRGVSLSAEDLDFILEPVPAPAQSVARVSFYYFVQNILLSEDQVEKVYKKLGPNNFDIIEEFVRKQQENVSLEIWRDLAASCPLTGVHEIMSKGSVPGNDPEVRQGIIKYGKFGALREIVKNCTETEFEQIITQMPKSTLIGTIKWLTEEGIPTHLTVNKSLLLPLLSSKHRQLRVAALQALHRVGLERDDLGWEAPGARRNPSL